MAVAMRASTNDYPTRHHHSDYTGLTPHANAAYFTWHESSLTPPSTASTCSQRSVMHADSFNHGSSESASSAATYNPHWNGMYSSSSSENNYTSTLTQPQGLTANRTGDSTLHGLSYRSLIHPTPVGSLQIPADSTISSPRELTSHALESSYPQSRRYSHSVAAPTTTYSANLAAASWEDGLIPFEDAERSRFSGGVHRERSSSPMVGPAADRSQIKAEPDEANCQFILETYTDESIESPILPPSPLEVSFSGTTSKRDRSGRGSSDSQSRRPNSVPLRAVNASPEMYAMMGVIRLDPFACVNGVPQNKNVPSLWNGEPRPLDEEPILLEWQVDLLEPLVPQTPESEFAQLPEIESEDGFDAVKLGVAGPMRERLRSPLSADWREGGGSGARMSTSSRGSASPILRLLHDPKAEGISRSPPYHTPRGTAHGYIGHRDSEDNSAEFPLSNGSSVNGYTGLSTIAKTRGQVSSIMDGILDQGAGMANGSTSRSRGGSYVSPLQPHGHQAYSPNSVHLPHPQTRQRSDSHAMQHATIPHSSQGNRTSLYEPMYSALQPHNPQSFTLSSCHSNSLLSQASSHAPNDVSSTYEYSLL